MAATKLSSSRRTHGDAGASVVEFALTLPFLVLIVFGIIDFGTLYSDYTGLRSATRDATRSAAVTNWGSDSSCLVGGAVSAPASSIICDVKRKASVGDNVRVGVWAPGGWQVGATLRVCAQEAMTSTTGFTGAFINGRAMTAKVEFRIELPLPAGVTFTPGQEPPITSWPSNCTAG